MDNGEEAEKGESNGSVMDVNGNFSNQNLPRGQCFERRQYQVELIQLALRENVILTLPTGSGKTFIALKVIERMLADNYGTGKKVVFLACTIPLVKQQAGVLRDNLPPECVVHYLVGDLGTDFYNPQEWVKLLSKCNVFVMTAEILHRALLQENISWNQLCLLILDECHHATGSHNYVKVMDTYKRHRENGSSVPRVVGLTATIVKGSAKVSEIKKSIEEIENKLCCRAVTHPNFDEILKFSTSASVELVTSKAPKWSVKDGIFEDLQQLMKWLQSYTSTGSDKQQNANTVPGIATYNRKKTIYENLVNILTDFFHLYEELGPCSSRIATHLKEYAVRKYLREVESLNGTGNATVMLLNAAITDFIQFRQNVLKIMDEEYKKKFPLDNKQAFYVEKFNSEKIDSLLDILLERNAAYAKGLEEPPCGLVFCRTRSTVQVLAWFLQDLAKQCSKYSFLKVDFILGSSGKLDLEAGRVAGNWQTNVLERFRNKELNMIIATSVLEEGLDVPSCNLIIRFNPVENYPSFIQSMGRARMKNAKFYVLVAQDEFEKQSKKLEEYKCFNQQLAITLAKKLGSDEAETEMQKSDQNTSCIPTFCPGGKIDSPILPQCEAIPAVYRYCSLLKSDGLSQPAPVAWCETEANGTFKASLLLPCSTPILDVIKGEPCSNKTLAKQSVFCKACILLCAAGELTDRLLPRNQEDEFESKFLDALAEESKERDKGIGKLGTKKNSESYIKMMPLQLFSKSIVFQQPILVYKIELTYEPFKSAQRVPKSYDYDFNQHPYSFGILTTLQFTCIPEFSLRLSTGRIKVKLVQFGDQFSLSKAEVNIATRFQAFMANSVYCLPSMDKLKQKSEDRLLVVPLKKSGQMLSVDWMKMKELLDFNWEKYNGSLSDEEKRNFIFSTESYIDATVVPCYKVLTANEPKIYCVTKISDTTNADSQMPSKKPGDKLTYAAHYLKSCNTQIVNTKLPMLLCRAVGKQRNFLWCGKSKKGTGTCFEFPPEVVRVSPIPASLLLQGKYIPSILHRINRLVMASVLQLKVGSDYNWNVSRMGLDKEMVWGAEATSIEPKDWKDVKSQGLPIRPKASVEISKALKSPIGIHYIHPKDRTWEQINAAIDYENALRAQCGDSGSPRRSDSNKRKKKLPDQMAARNVTTGLIDPNSIRFESFDARTDFDKAKGPNVFQIMEALTLANANDYLNLERMEIMGDSVLKLIVSTHLFSEFPKWKEGKLTNIRTRLISNEHLCAVAMRRNFGRLLSGGIFRLEEWIPPGFQVSEGTPWTASPISDKSIADATEALIGAYYLEGGLDCALRAMGWIGLQGPGSDILGPYDAAYSRETSFKRPELKYSPGKKSPKQLVPYLEELEKTLAYKFKNKWLLVEALTHSTFMNNFVTQSYQRLEFLGDAVLDFLITHYIINSTEIADPGRVTDLRSALVNNVTFGCISERYAFPLYLLHTSDLLHDKITSFSEFQRERNYGLTDPYMLMTDEETSVAQNVDIPKALGDMFEAITGAIYVDSNYSLDKVWRVVYRLMKREIDAFSKEIPINPVRKVMEKFPTKVKVEDIPLENSNLMCVQITITGATKIHARGVGTRKKFAKEAAAKEILRKISGK